jgi:hypothetical protein
MINLITNLLKFVKEKKHLKTKDQSVKQGKTPCSISNSHKNTFWSTNLSFSSFIVLIVLEFFVLV